MLFSLTQQLMAIDSTTGKEGTLGEWLSSWLGSRGYEVERQPMPSDPSRCNIFATRGKPEVVLTTHLDCVPPFIAPRETATHHLGRGACDAKGIMAAQLIAAEELRARGVSDFGLLFVVGEETDSIGAKQFAKEFAEHPLGRHIRFLIDGEPTGNVPSRGHKGVLALTVRRRGVAGHSAYPERSASALHPLVGELATLLETPLPSDEDFGTTTVNIGRMGGGRAANVVADWAEADLVVRLARPLTEIEPLVRRAFGQDTELIVHTASDPAKMFVPAGRPSEIVRFGSDVPHLRSLGTVLLVGPGSIHDAHTADEQLDKQQQLAAVELYRDLVLELKEEPRRTA